MLSRLRDEANRERVRIFELTARELRGALLDRSLELGPIFSSQLVVVREQHLDRDTLGQLDRFVEDDLSLVDMSSDRLHADQNSTQNLLE